MKLRKEEQKEPKKTRIQRHRGMTVNDGKERERHGRGRDGVRRRDADSCGDANHRRQHGRNPGGRGVRPLFEPRSSREEG